MPTNSELTARTQAAVSSGIGIKSMHFAARTENAELWDVDGNRYVDFGAGIAVLNTGHRHPAVIAAVKAQLDAFTHTAFQVTPYELYVRLAERLNALAPIAGPAKTVLMTTGAEAVENAVKIARRATGRRGVIAFRGSFHGRTIATMALTGKTKPYKAGFGPMLADVYHLSFPGAEDGRTVEDTLFEINALFTSTIDPADVAAIIVEPVQGEGGFHVAPTELLRALRAICDQHGMLLIADEVQTGIARTGKLFAMEHSGVKVDLVTMAKGLGGGFPISAVTGRADVMDAVPAGGLGTTYGGSPMSCAAALAVLDVVEQEKLSDRAAAIGQRLSDGLEKLSQRNDLYPISKPRGRGAMVAFDVLGDGVDPQFDPARTKEIERRAMDNGLLVLTCGRFGQAIRLLLPLTITDALIDEGVARLGEALART